MSPWLAGPAAGTYRVTRQAAQTLRQAVIPTRLTPYGLVIPAGVGTSQTNLHQADRDHHGRCDRRGRPKPTRSRYRR